MKNQNKCTCSNCEDHHQRIKYTLSHHYLKDVKSAINKSIIQILEDANLLAYDDLTDYEKAVKLGLTTKKRWQQGIQHHPMSITIMDFLCDHDFNDYDDHFCWKTGGDGDNGEALMYEMDALFELWSIQQSKMGVHNEQSLPLEES